VSDTDNSVIRKINTAGNVSNFAGGIGGYADGTGSNAKFASPRGLTVISDGSLYVADEGNGYVRKISPTGVVTTLTDSTGNIPRFGGISGVAVDGSGNVYAAANLQHSIARITPNRVVTTFAGSSPDDKFIAPYGVGTNHNGIVYVTDWSKSSLSRITPDGQVDVLPPSPGTYYNGPKGVIADDNDNITVADTLDHAIQRVTAAHTVTTLAGLPGSNGFADGVGSAARFQFPSRLTADKEGNIFVADTWNAVIRLVTSYGEVKTIAGTHGVTGSADGPAYLATFNIPSGIAVDPDHNFYVADTGNHTIRKISNNGIVSTIAGLAGQPGDTDGLGSAARFYLPDGLARDRDGNLYVADTNNHRIRKISPQGLVTTIGGSTYGYHAGPGSSARFAYPNDIAIDDVGNIYVADGNNRSVRIGAVTVPPQILQIMVADGGGHPYPLLFGHGAPNGAVTISSTDSLLSPFNSVVGAPTCNAAGNYRFDDTASANRVARFYRAIVPTQ
jgi:sugar lactone lactonase YvrE